MDNRKTARSAGTKASPVTTAKITSKPGPMLYPVPAVMVSCGTMEQSNIITIAWTGIINSNPPMLSISMYKSRYSHPIILESGEFVVNLVTEELVRACDYCGVRSGSSVDKFAETGLTRVPGNKVAAPLIAESPINLECKVTQVIELPSHDMFLAEIVDVHIREDLVDAQGAYRFDNLNLVSYIHGHYYPVDRRSLGRFGFSVMKPETIQRKREESAAKRSRMAKKPKR